MLTQVTEFGSMPTFFASAGHMRAGAVAGRIADLLAGEILDRLDAGALEPVQALRRVGIDVHQADQVQALAAEQQHAGHVGETELRGARRDLLGGGGRAATGLEVDVDAGVFVPAHLLRVEIRRVVAAGDPVERERELLLCGGGRRAERHRCSDRNCEFPNFHADLLPEWTLHADRSSTDGKRPW